MVGLLNATLTPQGEATNQPTPPLRGHSGFLGGPVRVSLQGSSCSCHTQRSHNDEGVARLRLGDWCVFVRSNLCTQ